MFGALFSGVCHKENGENCSAEAVTDGRLLEHPWIKWIFFWNPDFFFVFSCQIMGDSSLLLAGSSRGDRSQRVKSLCQRVVMGLNIFETTGGFQGAGIRLLVFLRDEPAAGALGQGLWAKKVRD